MLLIDSWIISYCAVWFTVKYITRNVTTRCRRRSKRTISYLTYDRDISLIEGESSRVSDTNIEGRLNKQDFTKPDAFSWTRVAVWRRILFPKMHLSHRIYFCCKKDRVNISICDCKHNKNDNCLVDARWSPLIPPRIKEHVLTSHFYPVHVQRMIISSSLLYAPRRVHSWRI